MPFTREGEAFFPTTLVSKSIHLGDTMTQARVTVTYTGTLKIYLSSNGLTNVYETTNLQTDVPQTVVFTVTGTDLKYRIIGKPGSIMTYLQIDGYL